MLSSYLKKFNLDFVDLYSDEGLRKIDKIFLDFAEVKVPGVKQEIIALREGFKNNTIFYSKEIANFIINLSPILEEFIGEVFNVTESIHINKEKISELKLLLECKKNFIQRIVAKQVKDIDISEESFRQANIVLGNPSDLEFASMVKDADESLLESLKIYAAYKLVHNHNKYNILYYLPKKLAPDSLIEFSRSQIDNVDFIHSNKLDGRKGFGLLDNGGDLSYAIDQTHYCIFCHNQGKDSCSKGLKDKEGKFVENHFDITLTGCPLEEKISEMNQVKFQGMTIAPLAIAIIDNPLLAATGHRICNDCMKSCIYQKQEPVDIPQVESRVLKDVLDLDYGFEIYSLLTRWNPLNFSRPYPETQTNKNILVVGSGPAGFNMAHHMLNEGHRIVMIEGLKIEPVDSNLNGVDINLNRTKFEPIKSCKEFFIDLEKRIPQGFGGVAEYGITTRWNKNLLTLIRILLERRENFKLIGGVRFGSNITLEQVKNMGFDHVVLACGAGSPNLPKIKNILAKGVKTASDFLMALQSGGAFHKNSLTNLSIRLPIVVIGGGLTAIDTATEALAYYPIMLEKFFANLKKIKITEEAFIANLSAEEKEIFQEYKTHYHELSGLNSIDKQKKLIEFGGATIIYRKNLQSSPAYRLNHEEIDHALKQGIKFIENAEVSEITLDNYGYANGIKASINDDTHLIPAKSVMIAIGTNPNIMSAKEFPNDFSIKDKFIELIDEYGGRVTPEKISKPSKDFFLAKLEDDFSVSFIGDMHPSYAGNVVKAMASAKRAYPIISRVLKTVKNTKEFSYDNILELLSSYVIDVQKLAPKIYEIIIKSPLAAQNFAPGKFYRLQNISPKITENGNYLSIEPLALTGASVDKNKGIISLIVLEMGGSSNLCKYLEKGERIILMGPTGSATEIFSNTEVVLVGGGLGNAVLFSIAKALKQNGCKVIYFAGYRKAEDRFKPEEIEEGADIVVWCCDNDLIPKTREQDYSFIGNPIEAMKEYKHLLSSVEHLITIGSDKLMYAVSKALSSDLKEIFQNIKTSIASINSPMQCMMKEICAGCIQEHINPETLEKSYVYSCVNQDQDITHVNFEFLSSRLSQNNLHEKLTIKLIEQYENKI